MACPTTTGWHTGHPLTGAPIPTPAPGLQVHTGSAASGLQSCSWRPKMDATFPAQAMLSGSALPCSAHRRPGASTATLPLASPGALWGAKEGKGEQEVPSSLLLQRSFLHTHFNKQGWWQHAKPLAKSPDQCLLWRQPQRAAVAPCCLPCLGSSVAPSTLSNPRSGHHCRGGAQLWLCN